MPLFNIMVRIYMRLQNRSYFFYNHLFMQAEMQPVPLICEECFRRSCVMLCIRIILLLTFISMGPIHTNYYKFVFCLHIITKCLYIIDNESFFRCESDHQTLQDHQIVGICSGLAGLISSVAMAAVLWRKVKVFKL